MADYSQVALNMAVKILPPSVDRNQIDLMNPGWEDEWDIVFMSLVYQIQMMLERNIAGYASNKETIHSSASLRRVIWIASSAFGLFVIAVEPNQKNYAIPDSSTSFNCLET